MEITLTCSSLDELKSFAEDLLKDNRAVYGVDLAQEPDFTNAEPQEPTVGHVVSITPVPVEEKQEAPAAAEETAPAEENVKPQHNETELKLLLSSKIKAGKRDEVKALLEKYGARSAGDLIKAAGGDVDALYNEAEAI